MRTNAAYEEECARREEQALRDWEGRADDAMPDGLEPEGVQPDLWADE